jgi:steroid 5-alpha reductase family enzyme
MAMIGRLVEEGSDFRSVGKGYDMNSEDRRAASLTPVVVAVGAGLAWAGSQGGIVAGVLPVFAVCGVLAFVINWIVFVPSYLARTERFFDLTGSITYLSVVAAALLLAGARDARSLLLSALIMVWAVRLGAFLFARINRDGKDARFDELKMSFPRFLGAWTLQGLWVFLTLAAALAAITSVGVRPLGLPAVLGSAIWAIGFAIEVVADRQKRRFREDAENQERFIQSGMWAWSRHPNYFGEILLWFGVAAIAFPELAGWQYVTLASPVFVYVLLTRISGIPLLEERAEAKWGDDPEYRAYRDRTPELFPRRPVN